MRAVVVLTLMAVAVSISQSRPSTSTESVAQFVQEGEGTQPDEFDEEWSVTDPGSEELLKLCLELGGCDGDDPVFEPLENTPVKGVCIEGRVPDDKGECVEVKTIKLSNLPPKQSQKRDHKLG